MIPAYFGHSWSSEDRAINRYILQLCWEAGLALTVDPKSRRKLCITYLELMMRYSSCFIAVAPHRPWEEHFRTSPYVVFEHQLAVRARKPSLVIAESNVARRSFPQSPHVVFHRHDLGSAALRQHVERLAELSRAQPASTDRLVGSVGLVLPRTGAYAIAREAVRTMLEAAGYDVVDLHVRPDRAISLPSVEAHDFLVIDIDASETPGWLHPELHGRFVPMVRLAHRPPGRTDPAPVPAILNEEAVRRALGIDKWMIRWTTVDELVAAFQPVVDKLQRPRQQFRSVDEGVRYIQSLGRSAHGPVFISNADSENDLARRLCHALDLNNIAYIHYYFNNPIPMGTPWRDQLWDLVSSSRLFVPLVTEQYWKKSLCQEEYRVAERDGLRIYPCFLSADPATRGPAGRLQGEWLADLSVDERVFRIVASIDAYFTHQRGRRRSAASLNVVPPQRNHQLN